jgi:hypothetical protein
MDPVAEVFDGGMVGVKDDLEGGREGGREGKREGRREGGLVSASHPGILEGRDQSAMDPVAEVFDGGMVGVEDDLEGGREGGREEGKKGGKGGREGGLLST